MRLLITAGPTREPIDAVRFISNRSSGRMGVALADAAAEAGHEVTLLLGPVLVMAQLRDRVRVERFSSSDELQALLEQEFPGCDALVMAAAVADYKPLRTVEGKLQREGGPKELTLQLQPTPDLVAGVAKTKRAGQKVVAFALEEAAHLEGRAVEKMRRKGVDAIVANPLATMEAGGVTPVLLTARGKRLAPGTLSKADFARWLVEQLPRIP